MRRSVAAAACALPALVAAVASAGPSAREGGDWTRFGYDAARHNAGPAQTGIDASNVRTLTRQKITLDGTVDASPIYLRGVTIAGRRHDTFFVTTSYGKTLALDADSGRVLWRFTPGSYRSVAGSYRITNSTPVADPSRRFVYAAAPDGVVRKLSAATGKVVWATAVTRLPEREKIAPSLNYSRGLVLVATGGYIGDAAPYQGHVVAISARTGRIQHVWNSLCSDRHTLQVPSTCSASDSAIWARSGVVVEPSGRLLVATGNGPFDGRRNWGDSVLELSPNAATLLQNWTPRNYAQLESGDVDLGSTAPALLTSTLAAQSGKDAKLRLLDLRRLNGRGGAGPRTGGELQTLDTPGGEGLFSAPAVWRSGGETWLFVATFSATAGYHLESNRLRLVWTRDNAGTSPVVAGGLLYVYDPGGVLRVYDTHSGNSLANLPAGSGHWNSPIVTDGRVALPEGDANDHQTSGVLSIYRLPAKRITSAARFHVREVARNFDSPVYVTAPRIEANRLYVVDQNGVIWVVVNGKVRRQPFLDIRRLVRSGGEQGLLSLAFHPDYATNRRFYVNYTDRNGDTRVVEYRSNGLRALAGSARQLLFVDQPYPNHNGGQLQFGPDGLLYIGMGDGGAGGDPGNRAQNLGSLLGKLLRIDVDARNVTPQIVAYGLRNPWRFSFDRESSDLYLADVGQGDWEEVDYLPHGALDAGVVNFGWNRYEGKALYKSGAPFETRGTLVFPVAVYDHDAGCSVTGGYAYRGSAVPAARGRYFYGDYCSGTIWSLRIVDGKAAGLRREFTLRSPSSFGEDARGELYVVSLQLGRIYRLTR